MMPGVELATKRKIHHREDDDPLDLFVTARPKPLFPPAPTRMAEPAILDRLRLEEKFQGLSIGTLRRNPASSPSSPSTSTPMPSTLTPSPDLRQIRHTGGDSDVRAEDHMAPLFPQGTLEFHLELLRVLVRFKLL